MSKAESIKENQIKSGKDMTRFRLTDDGFCPMMQIIKSFNNRSAMITFSMWDDFSFHYIISFLKMWIYKYINQS